MARGAEGTESGQNAPVSAVVVLVIGLVLLLVGGETVVRGASSLGRRLGLTPLVVGLTIVAFGTSAPELAVSVLAVRRGEADLAVGNVIGSNIANILLVLGVATLFGTLVVASRAVRSDIPVMIGASLLFVALSLDGSLGRVDGIVLLVCLVVFVIWTVRVSRAETAGIESDEVVLSLPVALGMAAGGIAVLVFAAQLVVSGASDLAESLGVPQLVVGLTVVALGTSAPEVATTAVAAMRGERDIAVGNVVGSNIFNLLMVLGTSAAVADTGVAVADDALTLDVPVMVATAVACLPIIARGHDLRRWEGAVFLFFYAAYLTFLVLDATDSRLENAVAAFTLGIAAPLTVVTVATLWWRELRQESVEVSA